MASVSIAARDSLRVSTVSLVSSQDRSSAVRNVHFLPMRTRLTPRVAYSALQPRQRVLEIDAVGQAALASVASSSGCAGGKQQRFEQPQFFRPRCAAGASAGLAGASLL